MSDTSDRSRAVALALAAVTGVFGGHRYYAGKVGTGMAMTFTLGGMGIWWLYDIILVATGEFRDIDDRRIAHWTPETAQGLRTSPSNQRLSETLDEVRSEVFELQERVDFMERMLAQVKERQAVPPATG